MSNIESLARLLKQIAPDKATEIVALTKEIENELTTANRRAMTIRKDLKLPAGTVVITPEGGYGVIGKDGVLDPSSVRPLNPHEADAVGGVFFTPSKRPVGSDGSGQSAVGKSGRSGLAAAVVSAQRGARGTGSLGGAIEQAQKRLIPEARA